MNKNLIEIISTSHKNNGKYLNALLETEIITMDQLINHVIETKHADYLIYIAKYVKNAPIDRLTDIVISSNNARDIFSFAVNVKNAPIDKLADALIQMKQTRLISKLILILDKNNQENSNVIDKLLTFICDESRPDFPNHILYVALSITNTYIKKLADAIIKTNDGEQIYKFAHDLEVNTKQKLTNDIINKLYESVISLKSYEYIINFVCMFDLPVEGAQKIIIDTKNAEHIYHFASDVENADIQKLADAIIETKNAEYICNFASHIENAPIDKLTDAICETNNAEYIYQFAIYVENADINKLTDAIIKTRKITFILQFIEYVPNVPLDKFKNYSKPHDKKILHRKSPLTNAIEKKEAERLKDILLELIESDDLETLKKFSNELKTVFVKEEQLSNKSVKKMTLKLQSYNKNKAN